jgi:hypothetical protein
VGEGGPEEEARRQGQVEADRGHRKDRTIELLRSE